MKAGTSKTGLKREQLKVMAMVVKMVLAPLHPGPMNFGW